MRCTAARTLDISLPKRLYATELAMATVRAANKGSACTSLAAASM